MELPKNYTEIPAIVASIQGSTAAADYPALPQLVGGLLEAEQRRLANLQASNIERHATIEAAIHQCAEHVLTPRACAFLSTAHYAGKLHGVLCKRHTFYDLDAAPSLKAVRSALKTWEPQKYPGEPNGPADLSCSNLGESTSRST